jgi:hypothetical protein
MAWTQADIDALKAAIATGARSVQYSDGSRIDYRSLREMEAVRAKMESEVSAASTTRVRAFRGSPRSGY